MTRSGIRLAALAACFIFGPANAHHSYAQFDQCKSVALEGEVTSVSWVNPHIVIDLKTTDVSYRVFWFSLTQLQQAGIEPEALKTGDHVVVTGNEMRDPALKVLSLVSEIRRPSDGWSWTRLTPRPVPPGCAAN